MKKYKYKTELIYAFDKLEKYDTMDIPFINPNGKVLLTHEFKENTEVLNELENDGWKMINIINYNNLIYGIFEKIFYEK